MTARNRYGLADDVWDSACDEITSILGSRARQLPDPTIAYSELVSEMRTVTVEPDSHSLAGMLEEVSVASDSNGRGMLSVLVVHKDGDKRPGNGFFDLARRLERDVSDRDVMWATEFATVVSSYGGRV